MKKLTEKLKNLLSKLLPQTRICKIYFEPIKRNNLLSFVDKNELFCHKCLKEINPCFEKFYLDDIPCYSLYKYDEMVQGLLYQIKGCFDIELAPIFLYRFHHELSFFFSGYTVVPIPSWSGDDLERGFNHVVEIFKSLKLPMIQCLEKTQKYKQSDQRKDKRKDIINVLKMSHIENNRKIKVLLVDDVHTTGNTLRAASQLLKENGVNKIKVLVIAKVEEK